MLLTLTVILMQGNTKPPLPRITLQRARDLRRSMTDAERALWYHLRDNRMSGIKFRRQHPIPPYIVDFCCIEQHLVIELDGSQHTTTVDARRTQSLQAQGWRVVRYWNHDVLTRTDAVLNHLWALLHSGQHTDA